jgi:hypothetical protein
MPAGQQLQPRQAQVRQSDTVLAAGPSAQTDNGTPRAGPLEPSLLNLSSPPPRASARQPIRRLLACMAPHATRAATRSVGLKGLPATARPPARRESPSMLGAARTRRAASPPLPPWSRSRATWLQQSLPARVVDDTLRTERLLDGLAA